MERLTETGINIKVIAIYVLAATIFAYLVYSFIGGQSSRSLQSLRQVGEKEEPQDAPSTGKPNERPFGGEWCILKHALSQLTTLQSGQKVISSVQRHLRILTGL